MKFTIWPATELFARAIVADPFVKVGVPVTQFMLTRPPAPIELTETIMPTQLLSMPIPVREMLRA